MIVDNKKRVTCVLLVFVSIFILVLGNVITKFNIIDFCYLLVVGYSLIKYCIIIKN